MNLISNEKAKLTSTWLNTLASGSILVGAITPTAALIYAPAQMLAPPWAAILAGLAFVCFGGVLHLFARLVLEGLKE